MTNNFYSPGRIRWPILVRYLKFRRAPEFYSSCCRLVLASSELHHKPHIAGGSVPPSVLFAIVKGLHIRPDYSFTRQNGSRDARIANHGVIEQRESGVIEVSRGRPWVYRICGCQVMLASAPADGLRGIMC
jgi:hypothetical protein